MQYFLSVFQGANTGEGKYKSIFFLCFNFYDSNDLIYGIKTFSIDSRRRYITKGKKADINKTVNILYSGEVEEENVGKE